MSDKEIDNTSNAAPDNDPAGDTASTAQATQPETAADDTAVLDSATDETTEAGTPDTEKTTAATSADEPAKSSLLTRIRGDRPAPSRGTIAVRAAASLLVGASLAAGGYFYLQDRDSKDLIAATEQARAAACEYAPTLATYDAKNLDPYFDGVLKGATGDWKQQFESTSSELREVLAAGEVKSEVNDVQCAIKSASDDSAEAIVVIGQTITSLGTKGEPAPGQLSMVMRLQNVDGAWLVDNMNSPMATPPAS